MKEIDGYQLLANAIVLQAVNEYREALRQNDTAAKWKKVSLRRFFRSDWFELLTNIDGELLMERLQEEVNNDR